MSDFSNLAKTVTVSNLLDAGVHFGHNISRWNPKMEPYIYGIKDGIHVMDLQQTVPLLQIALKKIYETVKNNGKVLFIGSKIQATELVSECAIKCDQYYVNHRWLGGILTNWSTISKSIKKLDSIEKTLEDEETAEQYTKKELLDLARKKDKLLKSFAGIRNIGGRPDLVVIIDTNKEHLAIKEAVKLGIPIVAVVDSNSDPDNIDFPIPGNDDAIRAIRLYCTLFADAALAGIQEALKDSGVDIGAAEKVEPEGGMEGVKKIEKAAKVSKTKELGKKQTSASGSALDKEDKKTAAETTPVEKELPEKSVKAKTIKGTEKTDPKAAKKPAKTSSVKPKEKVE